MKRPLREILSEMTMQEKVNYIWEYYKYFILGSIIVLILIIYTVYSVVNKKDDILNIVLMTQYADPEQVELIKDTLYQELLTDEERDSSNIIIQTIRPNKDGKDIQGGMEMQKMVAELSAGYIDFFIADHDFFEQMNKDQQLMAYQNLEGISTIPFPDDRLLYGEEEAITGIDVTTEPLFQNLFIEEGQKIICTPSNAKNTAYISRLIQFLGEKENK
ncbi:hypothetical protein [Bacillus niameyensis]|uniref:hypothetical protein n=1 Tax=Bacillus niameyensis TaxID=1522308 RepID=UPI0007866634|nr:hypothetical protein [Bacillus niameyensis]